MALLIKNEDIIAKIKLLAESISNSHRESKDINPPIMICVLKGGFLFFSELIKQMEIPCDIDFISVKSYNGKDNSQGVSILSDITTDITNRQVYIVDDIVDSGNTMHTLINHFNSKNASKVRIVTLLKRKISTYPINYYIFEIADSAFVYGYGLDLKIGRAHV